jgi:hypothetical protein
MVRRQSIGVSATSAKPARAAIPLPDFVEPMKATLVDSMPTGSWLFEIKLDGYGDRCGVTGKHRFPLGDVTGVEAVKIIETHASRPLVERSGLASLECGCVLVFPKPRSVVAVLLQDTPDRAVFRHPGNAQNLVQGARFERSATEGDSQ